jgi:hypothetical protein
VNIIPTGSSEKFQCYALLIWGPPNHEGYSLVYRVEQWFIDILGMNLVNSPLYACTNSAVKYVRIQSMSSALYTPSVAKLCRCSSAVPQDIFFTRRAWNRILVSIQGLLVSYKGLLFNVRVASLGEPIDFKYVKSPRVNHFDISFSDESISNTI